MYMILQWYLTRSKQWNVANLSVFENCLKAKRRLRIFCLITCAVKHCMTMTLSVTIKIPSCVVIILCLWTCKFCPFQFTRLCILRIRCIRTGMLLHIISHCCCCLCCTGSKPFDVNEIKWYYSSCIANRSMKVASRLGSGFVSDDTDLRLPKDNIEFLPREKDMRSTIRIRVRKYFPETWLWRTSSMG